MSRNLAHNFSYGAFGEGRGENLSGIRSRWGAIAIESGDSLHWNRWLDHSRSAWLSRDPIGILGGNNIYGYVGNNPVKFVDIFGWANVDPTPQNLPIPPELRMAECDDDYKSCLDRAVFKFGLNLVLPIGVPDTAKDIGETLSDIEVDRISQKVKEKAGSLRVPGRSSTFRGLNEYLDRLKGYGRALRALKLYLILSALNDLNNDLMDCERAYNHCLACGR